MTPYKTTLFITAIANIIAEDKSEEELVILTVLFGQLASTLSTISALKRKSTEVGEPSEVITQSEVEVRV